MNIYTAPSDIDRHRRDAAARGALVQHGPRCACEHCTNRRLWRVVLDAVHDLRGDATALDIAGGFGPAWMGVRP